MCADHSTSSHDQHLQEDALDDHPPQSVPSSSTNHNRDTTQSSQLITITQDPAHGLDPDDPETQRAAGSFGFTPADLHHLAQLSRPGHPLVAEYHGWTEHGVLAILCSLPPSPERTFLAKLFAIITGAADTTTQKSSTSTST
ncbi:hypothetical protein LPJ53_005107 [Coemansia erecta]|uniref:Uncharacterized protein n=1 Tax=Coemansia erecta TaxID=147472 RepID=A0A9W7XVQ4_9FUNG|nr:hypothetical protein LPJ53_005107 [Coemansia erecta]